MKKKSIQAIVFTGLMVATGIVLSQFFSVTLPTVSNPIIKFGIGYLPIIIISVIYGPVYGFIAAISQDLLGFFLIGGPQGQIFHLGFTLNAVLYGVVPGCFFRPKSNQANRLFYWSSYVLSGLFLLAIIFYIFNVESVVSSTLDDAQKYILLVVSLFGSGSLIVFNFLMRKSRDSEYSPQKILFVTMLLYIVVSVVLTPVWLAMMVPGVPLWMRVPLRIVKMPIEVVAYVLLLIPLLNTIKKLSEHRELEEPESK